MSTSAELLALFRLNPVDRTIPYRWADTEIYTWISEAQREACIRKELILDAETESICRIAITSEISVYSISPLIVRVKRVFWVDSEGNRTELNIYDRDELDRIQPEWRTTEGTPAGCVIEELALTLGPIPTGDGKLYLEVQRLPLANISASVPPEIASIHHDELINWVLYRAHQIEDDDEEKPMGRWKKYIEWFEAYFGRKPNADLKRKSRINTPHRTKSWW